MNPELLQERVDKILSITEDDPEVFAKEERKLIREFMGCIYSNEVVNIRSYVTSIIELMDYPRNRWL